MRLVRCVAWLSTLSALDAAMLSPRLPTSGRLPPLASSRAGRVCLEEKDSEGMGSFSDAFAKLAKASKPKKPGEGAPTREDVRGLPIRLGGDVRDNSLGSLRAAAKNIDVLKNPRNWETEEIGLLAVIAFTVGALTWGYFTYVSPPEPVAPGPSAATVVRQKKIAQCEQEGKGAACTQEAIDSTEAALESERQLDQCLNYAFGGSEKRMCQNKYGTKAFGIF